MNDIKQTIFRLLSIFLFLSFLNAVPDDPCYDFCTELGDACFNDALQEFDDMMDACGENPGTLDPNYASCVANAQLVYNNNNAYCRGVKVTCLILLCGAIPSD